MCKCRKSFFKSTFFMVYVFILFNRLILLPHVWTPWKTNNDVVTLVLVQVSSFYTSIIIILKKLLLKLSLYPNHLWLKTNRSVLLEYTFIPMPYHATLSCMFFCRVRCYLHNKSRWYIVRLLVCYSKISLLYNSYK